MKTVKVQKLSIESFSRYGQYGTFINPKCDAAGPLDAPIVFYRDMIQQELGGKNPSFSVLKVQPRPLVIDAAEYHNYACEVSMPMDNDVLVWVAPATGADEVPLDKIEVFFVPKGTMLLFRPGVWHHAAYALNDKPVNLMICMPERAYATDCHCKPIPAAKQLKISYRE